MLGVNIYLGHDHNAQLQNTTLYIIYIRGLEAEPRPGRHRSYSNPESPAKEPLMKTNPFLVCALCASLVHGEASSRLYHRLWNPLLPPPPFLPRAHVQNSQESGLSLVHPDNADQLFLNSDQSEETLYQVALQRSGDLSESDWDLSSVKAVRFLFLSSSPQAYNEKLVLVSYRWDAIRYNHNARVSITAAIWDRLFCTSCPT